MVRIAKESQEIVKLRHKAKDQIASENKRKTPQAFERISKKIQHWITRHEPERVNLKGKVSLFDENQHTEQPHSRYIEHLRHDLKKSMGQPKPSTTLKGRVTESS